MNKIVYFEFFFVLLYNYSLPCDVDGDCSGASAKRMAVSFRFGVETILPEKILQNF